MFNSIEILVVSNFDPLSKCCKRNGNSGSLSFENKWPVNWAGVALLSMNNYYIGSGVLLSTKTKRQRNGNETKTLHKRVSRNAF